MYIYRWKVIENTKYIAQSRYKVQDTKVRGKVQSTVKDISNSIDKKFEKFRECRFLYCALNFLNF